MGNSAKLCGYTAEYDSPLAPNDICCCREVWEDGRCIWHANIENKPVEELREKRKDRHERLDGAFLQKASLGDSISFQACTLVGANLASTDLKGADLGEADLRGAELGEANLEGADLNEADLRGGFLLWANLGEAKIKKANLEKANLIKANLGEADLRRADLSKANISKANLGGASLELAALEKTHGASAYLGEVDLSSSNLTEATLNNTNFTDANIRRATLADIHLEQANLTRVNLFEANLTGAELYGAVLTDIQFNKKTEFGLHYADKLTSENAPDNDSELTFWDKARWTNRQLERLARENALPEQARNAFERRKDLRRREYWHRAPIPGSVKIATEKAKSIVGSPCRRLRDRCADHPLGNLWTWSRTASSGLLMRYGESPSRVVSVSVAFILTWTLLYPIPGIRETPGSKPLTYTDVFASDIPHALAVLSTHLYFSTVTFTTLGYGDFQPVGWARWLATVESFVGALLMALLVFVLGRRATW